MKKILSIITMLLISGVVFANGIKFTESKEWKKIVAQAKKENKLIFLDAYASWCGPCKYLQSDVFTKEDVGSYFNKTYINVKIDMEAGEGPELAKEFGVTAYPTLFFVNGDGKVLHKYVGALDADELISLGKDAQDPSKQYYGVKEKAANGQLEPKAFHTWIHKAEKMEDEEVKDVIYKYLQKVNYAIVEKEMMDIIFEHAGMIPAQTLQKIIANKSEIMKLKDATEQSFDDEVTAKAISLAIEESYKDDNMDIDLFKTVVARYMPGRAAFETKKMQIKYLFVTNKSDKAIDELIVFMEDKSYNTSIITLASIIYERAEKIVDAQRGNDVLKRLQNHKLLANEAAEGHFKDFAQLCLYYKMDNKEKVKTLIAQLRENKSVNKQLLEIMEEMEEGEY